MIRYFVRRLLWIIPVLFVVTAITFLLMHSVPGGPWAREKALPQGTVDRLNQKYGLDQPVYIQRYDPEQAEANGQAATTLVQDPKAAA